MFRHEFSGWRSRERWLGGWESDQIPGILAGFLGFGPFPRGARCGGTGVQAGCLGAEAGQPGAAVGIRCAGRGILRVGTGSRGARSGRMGARTALLAVFRPLFRAWSGGVEMMSGCNRQTKSPLDRVTFSLRPNLARLVVDLVETVQRRVGQATWNDVESI